MSSENIDQMKERMGISGMNAHIHRFMPLETTAKVLAKNLKNYIQEFKIIKNFLKNEKDFNELVEWQQKNILELTAELQSVIDSAKTLEIIDVEIQNTQISEEEV